MAVRKRERVLIQDTDISIKFDRGVDAFINNCKARNLRAATIIHYENILKIIYKHIDPKMPINRITEETVDNFTIFLREKTNANSQTIHTNVRGLKTILYFFMRKEWMQKFHITLPKVDKEPIETYTGEELKMLLKKPKISASNYVEYRNWVIINLLLSTGCRAGSLVSLRIKDIDLENNLINFPHTKNRKALVVPISSTLEKVLYEYIEKVDFADEDSLLFTNTYGEPMNANLLAHNLQDYNKKRGVYTSGVHRFRHTFAKNWILNGGDIFRLQKILGHSSVEMVKNYVSMFQIDLKKDFDAFNPLENLVEKNKKQKIKIKN